MQVRIKTDVIVEPVTLAEVKAFCRLDADYASDDAILSLLISQAREKLEKHLNLSFAEKVIQVQWNGLYIDLPYGPIKTFGVLDPVVDYTSQGLDFKSVFVNSLEEYIIYPVGYETQNSYILEYTAGYENLPKALKYSLLLQIDFDYKNQGLPVEPLYAVALQNAEPYSRNLIIQ